MRCNHVIISVPRGSVVQRLCRALVANWLRYSRDRYTCYKKYENKLKSKPAEIGLIYATKSKKTRLADY